MTRMYSQESYDEALQSQLKEQELEVKANFIKQLPQDVRDLLDDINNGGERKYLVKRIGRCNDTKCADDYRDLSDKHKLEMEAKDASMKVINNINKQLNEDLNVLRDFDKNKRVLNGLDRCSLNDQVAKL